MTNGRLSDKSIVKMALCLAALLMLPLTVYAVEGPMESAAMVYFRQNGTSYSGAAKVKLQVWIPEMTNYSEDGHETADGRPMHTPTHPLTFRSL